MWRCLLSIPFFLALMTSVVLASQPAATRMYLACVIVGGCPMHAASAADKGVPARPAARPMQAASDDHACCATAKPEAAAPAQSTEICIHPDAPADNSEPECCIVRPTPATAVPLPAWPGDAPAMQATLPVAGLLIVLPRPAGFHVVPVSINPPWLLDAGHDRGARGPPALG